MARTEAILTPQEVLIVNDLYPLGSPGQAPVVNPGGTGLVYSTVMTGNTPITGATKTKITYDSKGLVTSGADATTADIADSLNKRYVTDANLTTIGNQSGTNTGNQTISNTSDATSHTATLSATGGSIKLVEGSGITLTTTGTSADGIVTIASTGGSGDMVLASTQTVSGLKTFLNNMFGLRNVANTFTAYFTNTNTADRTYTLKDANGTIAFTSDITGTNSGTNTGDETTARINALYGTTNAITVGSIELGHASDTTLSRVSAGVVAIEGVNIVKAGSVTTNGVTMSTAKMLGRATAGSGAIEEISVTGSGNSVLATNPTLTKPTVNGSIQTITADTDGATITFDLSASNIHTVTLAGNRTLALTNVSVGQCFMLRLQQDATGSRTVTFFTTIKWAGGSAPTLTTTASKGDMLGFICTSSGNYDGFVVGQNL